MIIVSVDVTEEHATCVQNGRGTCEPYNAGVYIYIYTRLTFEALRPTYCESSS